VAYLATAPKSNRAYAAFKQAKAAAKETGSLAPPMHAVNAPTKLMKDLGYHKGYEYDHDAEGAFGGPQLFSRRHGAAQILRADAIRLRQGNRKAH